MKILHALWDLSQGGAQTYVLDLLRQHRASVEVAAEVLALSHGGDIGKEIEKLGVPVEHIGMRNGHDLAGILKLCKYFENSNADIIHSHSHNFAFNWLLRRVDIPKIFTEHGGNLLGGRMKNKWAHKLFAHNYQKYIAISREMADVMQRANPDIADRICVIYNGTDIRHIDESMPIEISELPRDLGGAPFRVGILGRLSPQKGIDTFLETAAILARQRDDISFPIVGNGPLRNDMVARAKRLGIGNKVFFLGFRADAIRILKIFDVFLFTSNYEPFGLVLTESMAARVPIVALSLKGAVREIIHDCVDGFIVDRRDPSMLAERVIRLLDDQKLRDHFAYNAREKVMQHFNIEHNAEKILQIYRECLFGK